MRMCNKREREEKKKRKASQRVEKNDRQMHFYWKIYFSKILLGTWA